MPSLLPPGRPLVLDGPLGSELERRGLRLPAPLWSMGAVRDAPAAVAAVHRAHVAAGADIVTAATFRGHPSTLAAGGLSAAAVHDAVRLARAAGPEWVAGSMGPVADCYRPELVPRQSVLGHEHGVLARWLAEADVDLIIVETQNTIREAAAAAAAAQATGLPFLVSFVCAGGRLLSGEGMAEAVAAVARHQPVALLVNCTGLPATNEALAGLRAHWDGPWGAYPNRGVGDPRRGGGRDVPAEELAAAAGAWLGEGASLVGSCCGSPVAFTARLRGLVGSAGSRTPA